MKFLADMGISPKTVLLLKDLGHDAVHLFNEQLLEQIIHSYSRELEQGAIISVTEGQIRLRSLPL